MPTDTATDRASLLDLQRGDERALNRLIERWRRPLTSFAYRYVQNSADANDLVAETFVRMYHKRGSLRPDTNLAAWLFTALTNLCHNHHRWKRRHPTVALDAPSGHEGERLSESAAMASGEASPGDALAHDESLEAVRMAIDSLPHDLKVTVLLHHYEHLPYREVAAIVGCSERGVETRLYRARRLLREHLAEFLTESAGR